MDQIISISEFNKYFNKNGVFQFSGLIIKQQSVWLGVFDGCINESDRQDKLDEMHTFLSSEEFEELTKHPTKDPIKPLLTFPCTKKELRIFLLWAIAADCIHRDECGGDIKKIISSLETAEEIVKKGLRSRLTKVEIAKRVDDCFYGDEKVTNEALGKLLKGGIVLESEGYISCARRARKNKK